MLLEILSHDDDEGDLGQANDDDQPFGLSPGYYYGSSLYFRVCNQVSTFRRSCPHTVSSGTNCQHLKTKIGQYGTKTKDKSKLQIQGGGGHPVSFSEMASLSTLLDFSRPQPSGRRDG